MSFNGSAVFFDRDGTLNREKGYLHQWPDREWLPGVPEALKSLRDGGFKLAVVSNQAGVARGLYGEEDVRHLHDLVNEDLGCRGTAVGGFYFCPHHPDFSGPCSCRKPSPALILRAAAELGVDLSRSWMIGDKFIDLEAGQAAGCRSLLVLTGYGRDFEEQARTAFLPVFNDLPAASAAILAEGCAL